MRIRSFLYLATAATVGLAAVVYGNSTATPAPVVRVADRAPPAKAVTDVLVVTGNVVADQQTDVDSDISGRIVTLLVERGQRVEQGQVLARIAARAGTKAKPETVVHEIRAPFGGAVTATFVSAGEWTTRGNRLLTLVDDDPLIAELTVPAAAARRVALHQPVELRAMGSDDVVRASITWVGAEIDPRSRAITVEVALPKGTGLSPGTYVEGRIAVTTRVSVSLPPAPPARRP